MNASKQLDQYLESFRSRLKKLSLLQGLAASAVVLLLVAVIGAWFSIEQGHASSTVISFRLLLVAALAAVIVRLLIIPLKKLNANISAQVEQRSPEFKGRIETYLDMKQDNNPFADLLAEDALRVSTNNPVSQRIEQKEFAIPSAIGGAAVFILLYLVLAGPGMFSFSLQNLFAGWAIEDFVPPQSIDVSPGDQSVRRGANFRISTTMQGFNPDDATVHVKSDSQDWQEVDMVKGPAGFEFTFFSMQEGMQYYVSTPGLRSEEFQVQVVDLPSIENLALTYHFPEWTQRESETIEPGGDINTLTDTRIELTVTTSAPLLEGELILNSSTQNLSIDGTLASTEFTITEEGEYYIAAVIGDEQIRLSDDYFIRITEDGRPSIEFVTPGRDWNASNIEEVLTRIEASDDYGLDTVALNYSVNGGDWVSVDLNPGQERQVSAEHLFMLEDIRIEIEPEPVTTQIGAFNVVIDEQPGNSADSLLIGQDDNNDLPFPGSDNNSDNNEETETDSSATPSTSPTTSPSTTAAEPETIPLQPGDLISYYAEASDRINTERTDMYFIQIQPYNRRYSQSQLSGGGGGGQQGGPESEISDRQRQIIVSTWNLIREQANDEENPIVDINSSLLSDLQTTLAEQAQTLADRSRARQLGRDEEIERFITSLDDAVQAMYPAAENLSNVELEQAIQPAQEALQHLLRAEAVYNDITLTQQQGGGGGAGGQAQRDLAEMFELEMDMEMNQYETGEQASTQAQQEEAEDIMAELDELARRQEQLANNLRNQQQISDAQRWQQDMLRREAEELQERMDQLERQQQNAQQSQSSQQQNQQASNNPAEQQQNNSQQPGQPGQAGQQATPQNSQDQNGQNNEQVAQSELQRRLDSAIRAMNESSEAMRGNPSQDELQRAAEEAQRQLEGARDEVAQQQLANMQESFSSMAQQAEQMLRDQQRMQQQLQEATATAVAERESGEDPNSRGMELAEEWALAREKQALAEQVQQLQQQMLGSMQQFSEQAPDAARELDRANDRIIETELEQVISDAALYIDSGYGLYIAGNESAVTEAISDLNESLERAEGLALGAGNMSDTELDRALAQAQNLRSQLQQQQAQNNQTGQGQPGQQTQEQNNDNQQASSQTPQEGQGSGQQAGQQPGQQTSQGQQPGQQGQGGQAAGNGQLAGGNGGWWTNGQEQLNEPVSLPEDFFNSLDDLTESARDAVPELNLGSEDLAAMYDIIRELEYTRVNRNDSILAQEFNDMLALIEQLEVSLQLDEVGNRNNVRTAIQDIIPEEYQESVAEYYRRLSQD